jgi:hypothetical protein
MASSPSDRLKIELMAVGDQANTWGTTTNNTLSRTLEQAITGVYTKDLNGAANPYALTWGDYGVVAASKEQGQAAIRFHNFTTAYVIQVPAADAGVSTAVCAERIYFIINDGTAAGTIQLRCGTSGLYSPVIPPGGRAYLATDGTNWYDLTSSSGATTPWRTVTATGNVYIGERIFVNHTGPVTLTLPTSTAVGSEVRFLDVSSAGAGTNAITIATADSNTVLGSATTTVSTTAAGFSLVLFGTDWKLTEK